MKDRGTMKKKILVTGSRLNFQTIDPIEDALKFLWV